jgi:hypothetical protein
MSIFGAGSNWDGTEMKDEFFKNENFVIGWDYHSGKDLYDAVSLLKAGDIIYLKSNQSGSRTLRIKGIGIVTKSFIHCLIEKELAQEAISDWNGLFIQVKWIIKDEFHVIIPDGEGKLTNVRAATFYEEYLPFVQKKIIEKLFSI